MKDKIFGVLQRIGRSFMLPIAILPVAGLLLGVGSSFTNATMIETYHLQAILGEGTILNSLLTIMSKAGSIIFDNLPIIFAVGVAIGMAKKEKEVAALAAMISFFVMNATMNAMLLIRGDLLADGTLGAGVLEGTVTSVCGIQTLQMGVFGGIIVGLGVAALHNKFYKIQLPNALSFFSGSRFVPIISTLTYVVVGIVLYFVWPTVQNGIYALGGLVTGTGYIGTLIFGIIKRALIPFGLHHVFYLPFWQTAVGGTMEVAGQLVQGGQNIFFAQLADPSTVHFSADATRYFSGEFIFMIFGLPGAALAMYRCARNEKKKVVGGLLLSAALTAFLTGITEPLEFTFLFVAPILYVVHCVLAGISFMLMHIFGVGVGMTFSGGLIDMTLFGIMQGNAKTHWLYIVLVGIVYFFVYWGVFTFLIKKFNFKTPGREADNEETKLYTRSDVNAKNGGKTDMTSVLILKGLGGKENIADIDCCATRLRITVHNSDAVSEDILKQSGAAGVIKKGNGIQVIYGPRVTVIKSHLEDFMESKESVDLSGYGVADNEIQTEKETAPKADGTELFLSSPIKGKAVPLEKVDDEVFSAGILGQGIAIEPSEGKVFAPVDGVVENIPKSKHAIAITADNDANILIHVGLDTVELDGNGFDVKVANGAKIKKGDLLMTFNLSGIKKQGYKMITPIVVCNADEFAEFKTVADGDVNVGDDVIRIVR